MTISFFNALLVLSLVSIAQSQWYSWGICYLSRKPVVLLSRNQETGEFTVAQRFEVGEKNLTEGLFRMLEESDMPTPSLRSNIILGLVAEFEVENGMRFMDEIDASTNITSDFFYARECNCYEPSSPTVYCPFAIHTCLRPYTRANPYQLPGCRNISEAYDFQRTSVMMILIWYLCILACLCNTDMGSSIFNYLLSRCVPRWNEYVVDNIMRRDPTRAREIIQGFLYRQHRALEIVVARNITPDDGERHKPIPTSLRLRTKIYHKNESRENSPERTEESNESETDEINCTICFVPLIDGERVGSLSCEHLFHVECLKTWLPRRNVCPLCLKKRVATPIYNETAASTDETVQISSDRDYRNIESESPEAQPNEFPESAA